MSTSLDDNMVNQAVGNLDDADLPAPTVAALRLADVLTSDSPKVDSEFYQSLREHFSDGQILELGSALAVASGWQTFIEAFGIRPDGQWLEGIRN
ncbi:MAG: carboxymuconolactone decarboxylase family protein [Acidimicrobiales bacterium]